MEDTVRSFRVVAAPVSLADEGEFTLGAIRVRPALCELAAGSERRTVEPRVMQVLVALARMAGGVASRDELVRVCWNGRIVGDDAINNCVAKVRRLADMTVEPAFRIETIPRIGYRLQLLGPVADPAPAPPEPAAEPGPVPPRRRPALGRWPVVAGLAVGLAGMLGAVLLLVRPMPRWTVVGAEPPIAAWPIQRWPAVSPDGSRLAFSAGKDIRGRQIYLKPVPGGAPVPLTNDLHDDSAPAWSPDGREIAYVAAREGEPCRIMIMPVPAGAPRALAECRTDERTSLAWLPGGNTLLFVDRADPAAPDRIMRLDLATGRRGPVTRSPGAQSAEGQSDEADPVPSPDGRWLSFARCRTELACQEVLRDLRSGTERVLATQDTGPGATWSPDSRTLFLDTSKGGDFGLWAWPAAGGPPTRLLSSPDPMERLSLGPNGLLAVEAHRFESSLARSPTEPGRRPVPIEPARGRASAPDIAPDGTIVFVSNRQGGHVALWLKPPDGPARALVDLEDPLVVWGTQPRWSPDGSKIAFAAPVGGRPGFRIITAAGADIASIGFPGTEISAPAWSADGAALIFPGRDAGGWHLWRVALAEPARLTAMADGWRRIRSRGDELYGIRDTEPGIWRIDGTPRRLTATPFPEASEGWTISGDEIAYADETNPDAPRVLAQPIGGGPARVVAEIPGYDGDSPFAIDPRTGGVIYTMVQSASSDIELYRLARQ